MREMKTNINRFILPLMLLTLIHIGFTSCDNDDSKEITQIDINLLQPTVVTYTPLEGGFSTELTIYGANLGTDINDIRVTVNGVDTPVKSSNGRIIKAVVPENSGSGKVKLYIKEKEFTFNQDFTYGYQSVVETYLGEDKADVDGDFSSARFKSPFYLLWDENNALYIVEEGSSNIDDDACLRVAYNNNVTTLIKASESPLFERLRGISFSKDQNTLFLCNDKNNNGLMGFGKMIRDSNGFSPVETIINDDKAIAGAVNPITDEVFVAFYDKARICKVGKNGEIIDKFVIPGKKNMTFKDMIFSKDGKTLYISAAYRGHSIYKIEYDIDSGNFSDVKVLAGPNDNVVGNAEGVGVSARFNNPGQMDLDNEGNLYVADSNNHCIRKITPEGVVTTFAGVPGSYGNEDMGALNSRFNRPEGCKFGNDGALYIADKYNHRIRRIYNK